MRVLLPHIAVLTTSFSLTAGSLATDTLAQCLRYEPDTVAVTGVLTRQTFPGPPNYESIKEGDAAETGFYLKLSDPICLQAGDSVSPYDFNIPIQGVRLIQLVLEQRGYDHLRPYLGRAITVRGTLFAAFSGHHHAPMLLRVIDAQ